MDPEDGSSKAPPKHPPPQVLTDTASHPNRLPTATMETSCMAQANHEENITDLIQLTSDESCSLQVKPLQA